MKLQKLYAMILGLALIAPQANLQAAEIPANQGNFSWVRSTFGTLASFGTRTLTFPLTTLSFCYRNLFAGAILAGVAYWGYRKYVRPEWNTYQTNLSAKAMDCYTELDKHCLAYDEDVNTQNAAEQTIQAKLNACDTWEWICSKFGKGSVAPLFKTLREPRCWGKSTLSDSQKQNWLDSVWKHKEPIIKILSKKNPEITQKAKAKDCESTTGAGSLAVKIWRLQFPPTEPKV